MEKLIAAEPLPDYQVRVTFADGFSDIVDITLFIRGGISEALRDISFFNRVFINEFNGLAWENGCDFCPNFLREYIEDKNSKSLISV